MTQNAHVSTREPVCDILSDAARLGLELQPGTLPSSARFPYAAIDETLDPRRQVKEPHRRSIAMDTTITLGAEQAGERLVPAAVHRVERVIAPCFTLYGVPRSFVPRAFGRLVFFCSGGIPASSPKALANPVRNEHTRRVYGDGADYPGLAHCHNLAPGASAGSSPPGEPLAATELPPDSEEEINTPFLKVHAILAGGC